MAYTSILIHICRSHATMQQLVEVGTDEYGQPIKKTRYDLAAEAR